MGDDVFGGLDAIIKNATAKPTVSKQKNKPEKEMERKKQLAEASSSTKGSHGVKTMPMKRSTDQPSKKTLSNADKILAKLSAAGTQGSAGLLSTADDYGTSRSITITRSASQSAMLNDGERHRSHSIAMPYTLTVDDVATKMNNDVSRSQASQVLLSKIETTAISAGDIWQETSQLSLSQPTAYDAAAAFSLKKTKAKVPSGKAMTESFNP